MVFDNVLDWDKWQKPVWKKKVLEADENQVIFEEKEGEYSMEEVDTNRSKESKMFTIPPKTKLVLERKLVMKKLTLTYKATFQRHPSGSDHVVIGKFIRHIPVGIALMENYEPIN